tara:strand:- start:15 stop:251 length:237 start_codon:yes stop_codon:yes gene_type:complete
MKIYLVWYRHKGDGEERIRGAALNWERAEKMALNLELHMKSQGKDVQVGVKTYLHGQMFVDPEACDNRWSKDQFEITE